MKVLAVDIGGTNVKILATGQTEARKFPSGPTMTPRKLVAGVKQLAGDWTYDVVAIGYPGRVVGDRAVTEPRNLARGWVGFNFAAALKCPVKVMNDASMQALGSYKGGTMLFLGLGTGLGSALVADGHIVPMEIGALSYRNGTVEDYLGLRGLKKLGKKKWGKTLKMLAARLRTALFLDDFVIGGGNAKKLKMAPPGCRLGDNANAFIGGFRMWGSKQRTANHTLPKRPSRARAKKATRGRQ